MIWEVLLEYETGEKIRESTRQAEEKIIATKVEMKKLPFQEKVMKMVEIKQLQQEVQALCDQEWTREAEVEAHQSEAVQLTGLIC